MPRVAFTPENKANENTERYPKLKLGKDERGRIVCVEQPLFFFTHSLKAPKILNGEPIIEIKKRKDGTTYEQYELEFLGQPICMGDTGILADKGVDDKNCAACAASKRSDAVPGPTRRYAMNIVQYGIRPGGWELSAPFSIRVVIWGFTARMFDQLVDLATEWGNLRDHDLLLGPCEDATYQKWPMKIAQGAMWAGSAETKGAVKVAWESRATDDQLRDACGRKSTMEFLAEDVNRTEQRWAMARRAGTAGSAEVAVAQTQADLTSGLGDLLGGAQTAPPAAAAPAAAPAAVDDPFATAAPVAAPAAAAPAAAAPVPEVADPFAGTPATPAATPEPATVPATSAPAAAAPAATPASPTSDPFATPAATPAPAAAAPAPVAGADATFDELLG